MGLNNAVAVYDCVFDTDKHEQAESDKALRSAVI